MGQLDGGSIMTYISIGSKQFTFLDVAVFLAIVCFIGIIGLSLFINYDSSSGQAGSASPSNEITNSEPVAITKNEITYKSPQRVQVPVEHRKAKIPGREKSINSEITYIGKIDKQYGTSVENHQRKMISELKQEASAGGPGALTEKQIEKLQKDGNMIY